MCSNKDSTSGKQNNATASKKQSAEDTRSIVVFNDKGPYGRPPNIKAVEFYSLTGKMRQKDGYGLPVRRGGKHGG